MTTTSTRFYQIGGSLLPNAPSYVTRRADEALYDGLIQGEFCYVLTARQMGKVRASVSRRLSACREHSRPPGAHRSAPANCRTAVGCVAATRR
jgi:hypothetical protein